MSEMVEKVARAIWAERVRACAENGVGLEAWGEGAFFVADAGEQSVSLMNNILGEARAAIEAMREPTEAMLDASWTTCIRRPAADYIATELASPRDAHRHKTRIRHRATIDASLHEGEAQR